MKSYIVGSKAYFYCNKGYKLYGEPHRVCEYDGQWGGEYPVCKRKHQYQMNTKEVYDILLYCQPLSVVSLTTSNTEVLGYQPTRLDLRLISTATKATNFMENHGDSVCMMEDGVENTQSANVSYF